MSYHIIDLKGIINYQPIKECTREINNNTLCLDQCEREVVFVMAIYSVEMVIPIVFVKDCINQNFNWSQKDHESEVIHLCVRDGAAGTTSDHVGGQDEEGDETSVEESLRGFGKSHLDVVSMLEKKVADGTKIS